MASRPLSVDIRTLDHSLGLVNELLAHLTAARNVVLNPQWYPQYFPSRHAAPTAAPVRVPPEYRSQRLPRTVASGDGATAGVRAAMGTGGGPADGDGTGLTGEVNKSATTSTTAATGGVAVENRKPAEAKPSVGTVGEDNGRDMSVANGVQNDPSPAEVDDEGDATMVQAGDEEGQAGDDEEEEQEQEDQSRAGSSGEGSGEDQDGDVTMGGEGDAVAVAVAVENEPRDVVAGTTCSDPGETVAESLSEAVKGTGNQ